MSSTLIILRVPASPYSGDMLPFNQSNNEVKSFKSVSIIITCSVGSVAVLNGRYVTFTFLDSVTPIEYELYGYKKLIGLALKGAIEKKGKRY